MRRYALSALALMAAATGGCSSVDGNPHAGDSEYAWNYISKPGTPRLDSLVAGDRRILVYFTPSGGNSFIATCNVVSTHASTPNGNAYKSPASVDSLVNGVDYTCAVTAFNSSRPSETSAHMNATPKAP